MSLGVNNVLGIALEDGTRIQGINEIVNLHNGSLEIRSKLGEGTTVEVSFPLTPASSAGGKES